MEIDNAASRLRALLDSFVEIGIANKNVNCIEIWRRVFGFAPGDGDHLVLEKIASAMSLPAKVVEEVCQGDESLIRDVAPRMQKLAQAFTSAYVDGPCNTFVAKISTDVLGELNIFARMPSLNTRYKKFSADELSNLRDKFVSLAAEIRDLGLPPKLKLQLLSLLNNILKTIDDYQIAGIQPVITSIYAMVGQSVTDQNLEEELKKDSLGKKIGYVLLFAFAAISALADAPDAAKFIEDSSNKLPHFFQDKADN